MGFLREILGRPKTERPFILFPVGYPAADAEVPDLQRKELEELVLWNPTGPRDGEEPHDGDLGSPGTSDTDTP
jgi:hypothetical protein